MDKLPETPDDPNIRRLLAESAVEESPELLEGLRRLRSFRGSSAPEPTGELAALLQEPVLPPARRSRGRVIVLGFALAGAMAAGASGVAANDDLRLTCDSLLSGETEQVQSEPGEGAQSGSLPAESPETPEPTPEALPGSAGRPDREGPGPGADARP